MSREYTMQDVKRFLQDYKERLNKKKSIIPILGKSSKRNSAKEQERSFYETEYNKVLKEGPDKQKRFVLRMTPVLDEFYYGKKK